MNEPTPGFQLIACNVFQPAFAALADQGTLAGVEISYLPSNLHLHPNKLRQKLEEMIVARRRDKERIVLVYGCCFPDIDTFCLEHGVLRIRGEHCYEMLLGKKRYSRILKETAGTYFLDQGLITNFRDYCIEPLELDDEEMRKLYFRHYRRLVYLQQPGDTNLTYEASAIGDYLNLPLEHEPVDYLSLARRLAEIIKAVTAEGE